MGRRSFHRFVATTLAVASALAATTAGLAVDVIDTTDMQRRRAAQDVVVAGGIDGRVYAMDAWTGDVLWMFDSGGPMVDSSTCGLHTDPSAPVWSTASAAPAASSPVTATATITATSTSTAVSAAALSQMIPSYDGRLYHIDGASVRELDMTMLDIINANGPVRLSSPASSSSELSDLLLFGEKATKLFTLDARGGVRQPFASSSSPPSTAPTLLFGRAEYKTRALHARNMSVARCFTISEYFLQFADSSVCDKQAFADLEQDGAPGILVLPKDPDARHPDDEESTIAAYDPWTNQPLWELQIPHFDVVAVFGVSATRGASFFHWSVDGPSSSTQLKKELVVGRGAATQPAKVAVVDDFDPPRTTPRPQLVGPQDEELTNESKRLVKTVHRDMATMETEFRLRLLDGNYYLEPNDDDDGVGVSSTTTNHADGYAAGFSKRKRRVFWESMESGGKRGVFITYYHVGAMSLTAAVGCMLIAWGFYVKGLSASGSMHALQHDYMPSGHVHQLTIEQPGRDKITISSSITRALLLEASLASSGFGSQRVPLLENGDNTFTTTTTTATATATPTSQVRLDPATEARLLQKFTKMIAMEAAAALSGTRFSSQSLIQLEHDPDASRSSMSTMSSSTLTIVSDTSSGRPHRPSLQADDGGVGMGSSMTSYDHAASRSNMTEDNDGRFVPVIEELESSSDTMFYDDLLQAVPVSEHGLFDAPGDAAAVALDETTSSAQSGSKSGAFWESETTGSCDSSKASRSSDELSASSDASDSHRHDQETTNGSAASGSAGERSTRRKASNASSTESTPTPNEAEVLFPFVCQSRFANEFVELSALGKGGFGQVMLAENRLDGRKYAIKRVGLHLKNQTSKTLQKFLREVKILALLDHPHIVRYYQAWLEKVEEGTLLSAAPFSDNGSEATENVAPRNYSMSNLLAPISEMEFSNQPRSVASFYSSGSFGDDDGGFDWERNSQDGEQELDAWREEDLASSSSRPRRQDGQRKVSIIEPNQPPKSHAARAPREAEPDDSSSHSLERCDHWLYIQMQYCAGRNLGDYLALPTRTMELAKLMKIFTQIASAIAHVHSCGLIHRDLKPANIFVADTEGDSIKLGDFGLSRYAANVNLAQTTITEEQSSTSMFLNGGQMAPLSMSKWSVSMSNMSESQDITAGVGTYLYASPEQVAGKKYDAKTDMYSLGMILFELCHERFGTTMERYISLRNARERIFPDDFEWRRRCPEIMDMLEQLLHHDPMTRPDAADVVQWSQELYERSLSQLHHASSSAMRSPIHHQRSFQGVLPSLSLDKVGSAFSLQVEARAETEPDDGSGSGSGGERRLPNHNLLKELCDVIAEVSGGRMEIKKCGLHLQDGGAQILDFVLDPHLSDDEKGDSAVVEQQKKELMKVIEALPGVHTVRLDR